jgi:ribonuclease E
MTLGALRSLCHMAKTMLIDATHPEETRVAVVDGRKLEEFDVEVASRRPLKGNIYLAKVTRVEPSLQAAFVEYGGNRHGFLAFSEIHPDYFRIPVADREALLREAAEGLEDDDVPEETNRRGRGRRNERNGNGDQRSEQRSDSQDDGDTDHGDHDHGDHDQDGHHDHDHHDHDHHDHDHDEPDLIVSESGEFVAAPATETETPWQTAGEANPIGERDHRATDTDDDSGQTDDLKSGVDHIALASRQDVLRGDLQPTDAPEQSGDSASADNEDLPPAPQAEIVEVVIPEEVLEIVGGEEAAIQDDPEADEERARRRRQRNMRRYKIQEVIKRRQILLVQVTKEERGNKGAALTTYLSLAGRYCVLMPNTDRGGGISRRITSAADRKRLKSIIDDLDPPEGMAVIVRTAGSERSRAEVKRDFEYLLRLWDDIRDVTLHSTAPAMIYEEASLIKRSIRDLYTRDIGDIIVAGAEAYTAAKSFMRTLTPSHAKRVQLFRDPTIPLFQRYQIESQLAAIHQPVVQLKSGGYIVINQTEALVAVDVNSGRSTKERNIEETALRTNLEAADEVARQLRLRDLAGLIVIDFIDMEENRNNAAVERRMKEALKNDRARIQIGRISSFGLLEMSRQRLHPSLAEASTELCPHCAGTGRIRSVDSTALHVLRMVEEEITRSYSPGVTVMVPGAVALYILNQKRGSLSDLEQRRGVRIYLEADDSLIPPDYRLERLKALAPGEEVQQRQLPPITVIEEEPDVEDDIEIDEDETEVEAEDGDDAATGAEKADGAGEGRGRGRRRRRRGGRGERFRADEFTDSTDAPAVQEAAEAVVPIPASSADDEGDDEDDGTEDGDEDAVEAGGETADGDQPRRRRRRGRRGGRRRSRRPQDEGMPEGGEAGLGAQSDGEAAQIAGSGDQPPLPDALPPHWQQQVPAQISLDVGMPSVTAAAAIDSDDHTAPTAYGRAESTSDAEPSATETSATEQSKPRSRVRREEGERTPRVRKPRRGRDDAGDVATSEADDIAPAAQQPDGLAEAGQVEPALAAAPVAQPVAAPQPERHDPAPVAVPAVTVIDDAAPAEDASKRRGWWRRLMD